MDPRLSRLPGIMPLERSEWLQTDDAYAKQMGLRDRLIAEQESDVHWVAESAYPAADELYDIVLGDLPGLGFHIGPKTARRPDGVTVPLERDRPLQTLGRLVQEDLCLMEKSGAEHILSGAILCFPASWTLAEKAGKPLLRIHAPVESYDENLAPRVQRLFDAISPDRPLWRMNAFLYHLPDLFHPRLENDPRPKPQNSALYVRCERQCLLRLPKTKAVVFSIHTYVVTFESLPFEAKEALLSQSASIH